MTAVTICKSDGPIGARIGGVHLDNFITDFDYALIQQTIDERAVVVIPNQINLPPKSLVDFTRHFGIPQINVRAEANNSETPEIFWVSNIIENGKPLGSHDAGRYWHSDLCYLKIPSSLTFLHALEVPRQGNKRYGSTMFASATTAYDCLPNSLKAKIVKRTAHNGYRFMWQRKAREFSKRPILKKRKLETFPEDAVHPIVRTHPRNGKKCLYVCDGYTHKIDGLTAQESINLLRQLFDHLYSSRFRYYHKWEVGDLLIWDNCAVQHKASFDYPPELRRRMQRCTIEGTIPY